MILNNEQKSNMVLGFGLIAWAFIVVGTIKAKTIGQYIEYFPPNSNLNFLGHSDPLFLLGGLFGLLCFLLAFGFKWVEAFWRKLK